MNRCFRYKAARRADPYRNARGTPWVLRKLWGSGAGLRWPLRAVPPAMLVPDCYREIDVTRIGILPIEDDAGYFCFSLSRAPQ